MHIDVEQIEVDEGGERAVGGLAVGGRRGGGGLRSGNGEFEFLGRPLKTVGWSKGDKFCLRLLLNCAIELPVCNF